MNGKRFLAQVDHLGMKMDKKYALQGFASYFCCPIIENYWKQDCDEATARKILHKCFEILFYRDAKQSDQ